MVLRLKIALAVAVIATGLTGCQDEPDVAPRPADSSRADDPTAPATTDEPVPVGDPPHIPYIVGDRLYLGNRARRGSYLEVESTGRSVVAYRLGADPDAIPVLFRDGRRVAVLTDAIGMARLSPDGTKLAWFDGSGASDHLVLRDLSTGRDAARVSVDERPVNADFHGRVAARSVSDGGTVVYTVDGRRYFSWHPGTTPVRVPTPYVRKPPKGFSPDASFVTVNASGEWAAWVTDRFGHNPESREANGTTDGATLEKRDDPQSRFTVTFPRGGGASKVMWETDTDVLLDFIIDGEGSSDRYLRCSVITRRCEYAPTPANPTI